MIRVGAGVALALGMEATVVPRETVVSLQTVADSAPHCGGGGKVEVFFGGAFFLPLPGAWIGSSWA